MLHLLSKIDDSLQSIAGLNQFKQLATSYLKASWQTMTAERTQRILRAVGVVLWVLGTIVLAGLWEVGKLAVREAVIAFQKQMTSGEAEYFEPQTIPNVETITPAVQAVEIAPSIGVRELRQITTQRGIRNAGRMRKPELLVLLDVIGEASALRE
jgi:hypothetical protein